VHLSHRTFSQLKVEMLIRRKKSLKAMQMVKTDAKVSLKVYYIKFLNSVPNVSLLFLILTKDLDVTERKNAIEVAVADPHPATLLVHPCRNLL
jgi:hypothetical protein